MKSRFFERTPLYVFLIALYPVLFLLSVNISQVNLASALRSGLVFLFIGILMFLIFLPFTRNVQRSAFYALILLLLFFLIFFVLYAPVYRSLRDVQFAGTLLGRHRILVPATLILLMIAAACLTLFGKKIPQKTLNNISISLNLIAIILVVFPIVTIISSRIKTNQQMAQTGSNLPPVDDLTVDTSKPLPDVYYIILDMHTNDNVLRNLMDFDNPDFTNALQQRGFIVSECSQSNYNTTQRSVTSSLNMDYLQTLGMADAEPEALFPALQQNRVRRMLEKIGYATYSFEAGYRFVEIRDSGHYSAPTSSVLNILAYPGVTSFESLILNVSAGKVLYENRTSLSVKMQSIIDAPYAERRAQVLNTLENLPKIALENGPKLIYAHIMAPHDPFVFDENGNPVQRSTPYMQNADAEYDWATYQEPYVNEIIYLHDRILEVVDQIIKNSKTPPIIILQGDHGLPRTSSSNAQFQILNAYFFPGITTTGLYDTISPVNSFRLVFNDFFGMNYPLLTDESYLSRDSLTLFTQPYPCPNN